MSAPTVLLLAGFPNSGTTIASYAIGQHPQVFVAGELARFPAKQLKAGKLCACGAAAASCGFWAAVVRRLGEDAAAPMARRLGRLYRAIAAESGAKVVLDVAHDLRAVADVRSVEDVDLRLVHLERRGPAILNSRMRRYGTPGHEAPPGAAPRMARAFRHVVRWRAYDRAVERLRRGMGERAALVRYEALCAEPAEALAAIGRVAGLDFGDIGARLAAGEPFALPPHMIRGNPGLKAKDVVRLVRDDGFVRELRSVDRLAYAAARTAAPALLALRGAKPD